MNMQDNRNLYTHRQLVDQFRSLGVSPGQVVMMHVSVKAVGHVMGGPNVILQALLDVLGADGTLMMYAGWQDIPDFVQQLPPELRHQYYAEHPPFDPAISRSFRDNSILVEFLRTWPGTLRSQNPEASMVALGKHAEQLTQSHSLNYGYGAESPLARLVELRGYVLMLGAPLDTITLLHHAENRARLRHKNVVHYQCPILINGVKTWVDIEDYDTGDPHDDYSFEAIAAEYVETRSARSGSVGDAECYLLDAVNLTAFAVDWLESRFGEG
jgi:aminoglycoside 3-N-acetyltransferase